MAQTSGIIIPKTSNRFRVLFDGFAGFSREDNHVVLTQQVVTCDRGTITVGQPDGFGCVRFRDDVRNLVDRRLQYQCAQRNTTFTVVIETLHGDTVLSRTSHLDCEITKVLLSQLDYAKSDPAIIDMTYRFGAYKRESFDL